MESLEEEGERVMFPALVNGVRKFVVFDSAIVGSLMFISQRWSMSDR